MNDKSNFFPELQPQKDNLDGWFKVWRSMRYFENVIIGDGDRLTYCSYQMGNKEGVLYDGKLEDMTYKNMLEIENYLLDHIEVHDNTLMMLGREHISTTE